VNRTFTIISLLAALTILAAVATVALIGHRNSIEPVMSEGQRLTRNKIFGTGMTLPPIEKGQEMRPRW
jgi:Ti type entry exclusion protein TrbK